MCSLWNVISVSSKDSHLAKILPLPGSGLALCFILPCAFLKPSPSGAFYCIPQISRSLNATLGNAGLVNLNPFCIWKARALTNLGWETWEPSPPSSARSRHHWALSNHPLNTSFNSSSSDLFSSLLLPWGHLSVRPCSNKIRRCGYSQQIMRSLRNIKYVSPKIHRIGCMKIQTWLKADLEIWKVINFFKKVNSPLAGAKWNKRTNQTNK